MKRLGLVFVAVVVVMGITASKADGSGPWYYHNGLWYRSGLDYPRDHYRSRPVVDYDSRVGPYRDDNEAFYGPGSVSDFAFGWRADRVLKMREKEQDFRQEQERAAANRETDKEIFADANQRGKIQQLEDANKRLQQENAELRRELSEIKKMLEKLLAEKSGK